MGTSSPDIAVLRKNSRGTTAEPYARALRERLPDQNVQLARTPQEERELVSKAPIVTGFKIDEELLQEATELRLFACLFAGYNHLPLEALRERNVAVTTASGHNAPNVAEWVVGNVLVFARRLHVGMRRRERREWRVFGAGELKGSTVTVVGLGSIGQAVVERLAGFDVETIGVRYTPSKGGPTDEVIGFESEAFYETLARTDYLVLTCRLSETTEGLIGKEEFATLPPDSVVINSSRGKVIDTDALVSEVRNNSLRGVALDVTDPEPLPSDHPLWSFENVLITPHNAGGSPAIYGRLADIVARNVRKAEETGQYRDLENQIIVPE